MNTVLRTLASGAPGTLATVNDDVVHRLEAFVSGWDPQRDPEGWLLAERAGKVVGWARMDLLHAGAVSLVDLYVLPCADRVARVARGQTLLRAIAARFSRHRLEAATWLRHTEPFVHTLLTAPLPEGSFQIYVEKLYVRRDLTGFQSPYPDAFALRSLAEVGETAFISVLGAALQGSLARDMHHERPALEFEEMRAMEGRTHDPSAWAIALLSDQPVGVIMPNRFAGSGDEGTFTFLGLARPWRGTGLGPALHARGLELLAAMGARRYLCSTDVYNTPMLRLYARHGCTPFDVRRQYLWGATPRPG